MSSLLIVDDSLKYPQFFYWNGPIEAPVLDAWLEQHSLDTRCPSDLRLLWELTGGGDLFDTDTILGPFGDERLGDEIISYNRGMRRRGLVESLLVFYHGLFCGAVDLTTGQYLVLATNKISHELLPVDSGERFSCLDEWYHETVRNAYAAEYGLL